MHAGVAVYGVSAAGFLHWPVKFFDTFLSNERLFWINCPISFLFCPALIQRLFIASSPSLTPSLWEAC